MICGRTEVTDPASDETGAGAASNFDGGRQAQRTFSKTAGVVKGRPGIIEPTNIDPLNKNSNKGNVNPSIMYV
jgi:hypothetical protein